MIRASGCYIQAKVGSLLRETADWYIVARGDAWSDPPANVNPVFLSKDGTAEGHEFMALGAKVTVQPTYYNLAFVTADKLAECLMTPPKFGNDVTKNNFSVHFNLYFTAVPAFIITLFSIGGIKIQLNTASKLVITDGTNTSTGATVLNTATTYRIEARRTINGTYEIRIDGGAADATIADSGGNTVADADVRFGEDYLGDTNPNTNVRLSSLACWIGNDTPPWWGSTTLIYGTVDAAGTYNDGIGVPDTTNKYNNVDDYTAADNDTTYNSIGKSTGATSQTHNLADGTFADTIKAIYFTSYAKPTDSGYWSYNYGGLRVRDNSVNYDTNSWATTAYAPHGRGYDHRPGGGALTQATINAMEMGIWRLQITTGQVTPYSPIADSTGDDDWTGYPDTVDKYKNVDDYSPIDDTDYIEDDAINHRQAFFYTIGTEDQNIYGLNVGNRLRRMADEDYKYKIYVKISGTRYYSDEKTPPLSFMAQYYTWDNNPATGIPWRKSEIEAAEFGMEITEVAAVSSQIKKVSGVSWDNTKKVSGILKANIKKISGVSSS